MEAFLGIAATCPRRPAIVHNGRPVAYAELARAVWAVADLVGPSPGAVGVLAAHNAGTVAAMLGIWAAGGTYCPVDPAFPAQRRQAMLAAAGCRSVLDPDDVPWPADDDGTPRGTLAAVDAERPAYILFTSGSTGQPKPVVTPRRAIATVTASLRDLFDLSADDRVLQFASLNWDTCLEEILPTLTTGACLVMNDDAHTGSFPRFLRLIERDGITAVDLPTAFWHELVHYLIEDRFALPPKLRLVVIGGESASPARLADWASLDTSRVRLLNTYGCTETTLITHAADLCGPQAKGGPDAYAPVPIGRPLPHVVQHIGVDGELSIGGPGLALGYRGLPEATEQRFTTIGGMRFFRTGDRVEPDADGVLIHHGRLDNEIKIRGIRVNPAEVEVHLAAHPSVGAVAVAPVTVADHVALAAYVVPRPHADLSTLDAELRAFLHDRVPRHLTPSRISIVDHLPHTATGKIDREFMRRQLP
ncbi:MAG: amino acid adenylation domain-containing protein [Hamadaea sp.]|uniref:amino acid adenylation domain-containing protein n=1 Tax=Hamadaea sp. TaxID=2024425 RepID=UPI00179CBCE0|nr:amino acid adenylation domain-containing protein [Hamadaea sp.]NUT20926.1 amino acid adenylation domain-containing protein [Hamadaea sp.]